MTSAQHRSDIRAAVPQDRNAIIEVARMSELFPPKGIADLEATLDAFFAGTTDGDQWLVNNPQSGVAAIAYYAPGRMTESTWNLYLLAVHPHHQGEGLGAALVRQVEKDLCQADARLLLIETSGVPDFASQRAFYARLGYHEEARIREFYAPGDDKIAYWKLLQSPEPSLPPEQQTSSQAIASALPVRHGSIAVHPGLAAQLRCGDGAVHGCFKRAVSRRREPSGLRASLDRARRSPGSAGWLTGGCGWAGTLSRQGSRPCAAMGRAHSLGPRPSLPVGQPWACGTSVARSSVGCWLRKPMMGQLMMNPVAP